MANKMSYLEAVHNRRSIYHLEQSSPISDDRIEEIIRHAVEDIPSSFNSQSTRVVVLLKEEHHKFWDIVINCLEALVPSSSWPKTRKRIVGFRNAYGSILFYEDTNVISELQARFAEYADRFPQWSEHTSGMHQLAIWTALETEGLGANLQHYNPLPDERAAEIWHIPKEWQLKAQLVFGGYETGVRENLPIKTQQPIEKRLFIHGK